jgi:MFS superfamily sulfate permease-like transporter
MTVDSTVAVALTVSVVVLLAVLVAVGLACLWLLDRWTGRHHVRALRQWRRTRRFAAAVAAGRSGDADAELTRAFGAPWPVGRPRRPGGRQVR